MVALLVLSTMDCHNRAVAVVMLCIAVMCLAGNKVGWTINPADIALR